MKKYITFLFVFFTVISCTNNTQTYFNGEIKITDTNRFCDTLQGEHIKLDGLYTGSMWAYDTLLGFTYDFPDYFMNVFNVNTGKLLHSLCKRGQKAEDFIRITWTAQFVYENPLHLWIRKEGGKQECVLLDMTKSGDICKKKMNIDIDTEFSHPFGFVFILNDSLFLGNNQGEALYHGEGAFLPPSYRLYNSKTKQTVRSYTPFNGFVMTSDKYNRPDLYYYSMDRIKPDNTKLVQGMFLMDQINIIDIATGEIKGYRNKNSPDFNYLKLDPNEFNIYYKYVCVDDTYIYGFYSNTKFNYGRGFISECNTVNVFDWNGNFIKKIILDIPALEFTFDPVQKYLYTAVVGEEEEQVYRYNVNYLYK